MPKVDPREITTRFQQLKDQRTSWEALWRDIRDYELPDLGTFDGEDPAEGRKRYSKLYDAEAANCADVLAAGLIGGVSSPSRPWLRLTTLDGELDQSYEVKKWLDDTQRLMLLIFAKGEVYNPLHQSYLELPVFGTACTLVKPHETDIISLQNLTCGEYWLADDEFGRVDTMYRRFKLTAKQMAQFWGADVLSQEVKSALEKAPYTRFNIIHAIEPRIDRNPEKKGALDKPWKSVYFEESQTSKVLSESGYDIFPALCPRWTATGGSVYGRGPGAKALSASKSLQRLQYRLGVLVDYLSNPPVLYPGSFQGSLDDFRPGGFVPVTGQEAASIRSAWEVKTDPTAVQALIEARKKEIQQYYYANVFQMVAQMSAQNTQRTATEVAALEQEKVMLLGPVLERLHTELLGPLVDMTFDQMIKRDLVPPPPQELQGRQLNVEYISVLAEQQRNSSLNGIVNLTQQIGMLGQIKPEALDKLDVDETIDLLADMNGVPPSVIVAGKKVALIREQRAKQQEQAQQMAAMQQGAAAMKDIGAASDSQGLRDAMQTMQEGNQGDTDLSALM